MDLLGLQRGKGPGTFEIEGRSKGELLTGPGSSDSLLGRLDPRRHRRDVGRGVVDEPRFRVEADIVVQELSELRLVEADDLALVVRPESHERDKVEEPAEDRGERERVGKGGNAVGELVAELNPVPVDPTAGDLGQAVEGGDRALGKEGGEEVADDAADRVRRKDVERFVNVEQEFEPGGKVAGDGRDKADRDGSRGLDVACGRGDADEADDGARAETDSRPLALESVVEQEPGQAADRGRDVLRRGRRGLCVSSSS